MYDESIVQTRLACAEEELGFPLEYHSISEVDTFNAHLEKSCHYDAQGRQTFTRSLKPWEFRFIQNERILCQCDCAYYLTRYAKIADESDHVRRFSFRDGQLVYFSIISELERRRAAIELIFGKGRQQGVTTFTELLIGHRIFFHNDTNALTASADRVKTEEMAKKIFTAYDNLPWWMKPKYTRRVETVPGLLEFEALNTRVTFQHGSTAAKGKGQQKVGLGRGGTRTVWHCSEVSSFPKAEEQIEAALLNATHPHPRVFGVLESTFAGARGWFPEQYEFAKKHRDDGLARLTPVFLTWCCARDLFPTPTDEATHPPPPNWEPEGKVLEQIRKAELFTRTDPVLSRATFKLDHAGKDRVLGRDWSMPRAQQWFYHRKYMQAESTGTLNTLLQEFACDDIESKVNPVVSVFGKETLANCHTAREKEFDVYAIVGQSVESEMEPDLDEIDYHAARIPIRHKDREGEIYEWELVPLKYSYFEQFTGESNELAAIDGKLFIFKQPYFRSSDINARGRVQSYSVGADSSTGVGLDFSAISVTQKGAGAMPDIQCAEWRSSRVGHVEIFAYTLPICLYFRSDPNDFRSYPTFAIEQLASVGDVCQKEMKKLGYPVGRFYNWGRFDSKQLKTQTNKQGWYTTGYSRPYLIGTYVSFIRNGWYVLNSPWTIEDCREFEIHTTATGRQKAEHSTESYDDAIFAGAISAFILHDVESIASRSKNQRRAIESTLPPLDVADQSGGFTIPTTPMSPGRGSSRIIQPSLDDIIRGGAGGYGLDKFRY